MTLKKFSFNVVSKDKYSRSGLIKTHRGNIKTPVFMPVGTQATVKATFISDIKKTGTEIILANTYHLMLRPGLKRIKSAGGLHKFMNWNKPILTDSGGFQIFSLGHGSVADEIKGKNSNKLRNKSLIKIMEEGALFQSYIDGSKQLLSPEKSIEIQRNLGADLILVFDECTPFHVNKTYTSDSMARSHRWSQRSINSFMIKRIFNTCGGSGGPQALYGIIQGGIYHDLRDESIAFNLNNSNFFGLAIGGSLGSSKEQMYEIVKYISTKLENKKPVHLLGIGDPSDIWNLVKSGIDTFDCVSPTRLARHGAALMRTKIGRINVKNSNYKEDLLPIDENCNCITCRNYSKSYLHHLFKTEEILGYRIATQHNLKFYIQLMKTMQLKIKDGKFLSWSKTFIEQYKSNS